MFNAAASEPSGEWYLGVYCRKCRAPIPVFRDPGRGTAIAAGSGTLTVACPRCGKKAPYTAREVITFLIAAERAAPADRAPVNDDRPTRRDMPGSETTMAEPQPVLDLAPYEIPDVEPEAAFDLEPDAAVAPDGEPVLELEPHQIPEPEAIVLEAGPLFEPLATSESQTDVSEIVAKTPSDETSAAETPIGDAPAIAGSGPAPESEPVLELGPYEISEIEAEPVLKLDAEATLEADAAPAEILADAAPEAAAPVDEALVNEISVSETPLSETPVTETPAGADQPVTLDVPAAEPEPVLELVPQDKPAPEPASPHDLTFADELETFLKAGPAAEPAPAVETRTEAPETMAPADGVPAGETPVDHPVSEAPIGTDHAGDHGMPLAQPEPVLELGPPESPEPTPADETGEAPAGELEPARHADLEAALDLEAFFAASPVREPAPADEAPPAAPELAEPASGGEVPAGEIPVSSDHPIERGLPVEEPEPVLELAPPTSPEPEPAVVIEPEQASAAEVEPVRGSDLEAPLELEAFFEAGPAAEPAPAAERPADIPEALPAVDDTTAEAAPVDEVPIGETLAGEDHPIDLDTSVAETEPAPAIELDRGHDADVEPIRQPDLDAALELETFFETSPIAEPAPAFEPEAAAPEPTADTVSASETPVAEPEAAPEHGPHETPELEPVRDLEAEQAPDVYVEPVRPVGHDAALELEAFFETSPVPEPTPTVETRAGVPQITEPHASEALAREALVRRAPAVATPELPPPPPPPPAPPPPPPAPKPIAVVYRERWADAAGRPQIIRELRPLIHGLKTRAEAQRYDVLVRVTDLFMDYLEDVAPERQSGAAIEQYIHAVFALSARGRTRGTDRVGEEMAATLRALNRHAGLYTHR